MTQITRTAPPETTAPTTAADGTQLSMTTKDMRRVIASSFMGSMIEFYDFILYATAASLVFGQVFFAGLGPAFATFASFATFAVGYLARPLGGIVFGHFGDTRGRKVVLILTMVLMGVASTIMGLLPPTDSVGIIAPILLVLLRVVQGISVGGEWGGAILVALEHAPKKHRGLAASFANAGGPVGAVLATLMLSLFSLLPEDQFLAWGWRVPFLFSIALVAVGLVIRLRVAETPMFQQLEQIGARRRVPILDVLRNHWRAVVIAFVAVLSFTTSQGLMTVWGVSEAVNSGADSTGVLNWKAAAAVVTVVVSILAARASDRLGRRTMIVAGCVLGIVLALPIIGLLQTGTVWGFAIAIILGNGLVQGMVYGPIAAFVAEQFPTSLRFSGASAAYQSASTIGAGFSPLIATSLVIAFGATWPVAVFWMVVFVASAGAVLLARESKDVDIHATRGER
ncbi:MFS transporter [Agromyces kandeliae]|uniref:MFS transporter n=1 Tax=Agromyces kandeliae TaxID=2666141 RepID=A0A6L5R446_9MICO|nr:MFS transporter [Agromyces kandeliae]MRX44749.1 MFS transporter [Agromyces kandeliae]